MQNKDFFNLPVLEPDSIQPKNHLNFPTYAGFWIRFFASFLDSIIILPFIYALILISLIFFGIIDSNIITDFEEFLNDHIFIYNALVVMIVMGTLLLGGHFYHQSGVQCLVKEC